MKNNIIFLRAEFFIEILAAIILLSSKSKNIFVLSQRRWILRATLYFFIVPVRFFFRVKSQKSIWNVFLSIFFFPSTKTFFHLVQSQTWTILRYIKSMQKKLLLFFLSEFSDFMCRLITKSGMRDFAILLFGNYLSKSVENFLAFPATFSKKWWKPLKNFKGWRNVGLKIFFIEVTLYNVFFYI